MLLHAINYHKAVEIKKIAKQNFENTNFVQI